MIYTFIDEHCADLPISVCCRTMKVSRLMAHELTHLYRSMQMAGVDSDGVDDRYWYLQYVLGDSGAEEDCAYQVGQGGEDESHLVAC